MTKKDILIIIETVLVVVLIINSLIYMTIARDLQSQVAGFYNQCYNKCDTE